MDNLKDGRNQQLLLERVVPAVLLWLLYIADQATDIAVAVRLLLAGPAAVWGGWVSISLVFLPMLVYGVREVLNSAWQGKCSRRRVALDTAHFLFSPIIGLLRHLERVFWLVESVFAREESTQVQALQRAAEPRRIELYLFLRPILQAAPQSLLQMVLLVHLADVDTRAIQALSMLTSLMTVSVFAATFQRYESLKDRRMPWIYPKTSILLPDNHPSIIKDRPPKISQQENNFSLKQPPTRSLQDEIKVNAELHDNNKSKTLPRKFAYANSAVIERELADQTDRAVTAIAESHDEVDAAAPLAEPSSETAASDSPPPPIPPRHSGHMTPTRPPSRHVVPDENSIQPCTTRTAVTSRVSFLRHSYADSTPSSSFRDHRRSSYHYLPVSLSGSSNRSSSDIKTMSVPDFQAPPPPRPVISPLLVALPTLKPSRKYVKPETPIAHTISLLKWFLFLSSRVIALGGLIAMQHTNLIVMMVALGSALGHLLIMNSIIMVNSEKAVRNWWRSLILDVTSLYCLLELGMKFRKYTRIVAIYWPLCLVENLAAAFVAYRPDLVSNDIERWWLAYLFYTTCSTFLLGAACLLFNAFVLGSSNYVVYDGDEERKN